MSEKRLIYAILFNNYYQIREVDEDGYCRRLSPTGIIDSLNELKEENEQLRKDKEQLKERLRECGMRLDRFNCR